MKRKRVLQAWCVGAVVLMMLNFTTWVVSGHIIDLVAAGLICAVYPLAVIMHGNSR